MRDKEKCECDKKEIKEHECPYQSDVNNDEDFKCKCCEYCTNECVQDI